MMSTILVLLFAGSGLLAVYAMAVAWRDHGAAVLCLRQALRDCPDVRNYRFTVLAVGPRMSAPAFRPPGSTGFPSRPAQRAA